MPFITASMVMFEEKLSGRPTYRSADMLMIVLGALFLRNSRVCPTLLGQRERLPHMGTVCEKHMNGVRGPAHEAYMTCVSDFPYRVYIDLNRRDSQI
jgi:hypothetical protein